MESFWQPSRYVPGNSTTIGKMWSDLAATVFEKTSFLVGLSPPTESQTQCSTMGVKAIMKSHFNFRFLWFHKILSIVIIYVILRGVLSDTYRKRKKSKSVS